jgi:hypothetical protein
MPKSSHPRPVFYTSKRENMSSSSEKGQKAAMGDYTVKRCLENQHSHLSHEFPPL